MPVGETRAPRRRGGLTLEDRLFLLGERDTAGETADEVYQRPQIFAQFQAPRLREVVAGDE